METMKSMSNVDYHIKIVVIVRIGVNELVSINILVLPVSSIFKAPNANDGSIVLIYKIRCEKTKDNLITMFFESKDSKIHTPYLYR